MARLTNFSRSQSQGYEAIHELSNNEIMRIAPSVFAEEKHDSRSERYSYLPTSEILIALRKEDFVPYYAQQSGSRVAHKEDFTRHMLKFRHLSTIGQKASVGAEVNEIALVNSHDGTSKLQMFAARYVFQCCNGLMVGDSINEVSLSHVGLQLDNVIEGAYSLVDDFERVDDMRNQMSGIQLNNLQQRALGLQALSLKFDMNEYRPSAVDIIRPRRQADTGSDLWSTFNVIQENMIQGGVPKTVNPPEGGRHTYTRTTNNITDSVKLNRGMWSLAQAMAEAKLGLI